MNMIVICAKEDDSHALRVASILKAQHGKESFIFDTSTYPESVLLTGTFGNGAPHRGVLAPGPRRIGLQDVESFWWRRPQPMTIDPRIVDRQARDFAFQECMSGLFGILACCDTLWVNDIQSDIAAEYKPFQLKVGSEHGFAIPNTLITNSVEELMEFWDHHGRRVIYKAFNQRAVAWRPTRVLQEEDLALLENVRHAPVIFQAIVSGIRDVRVTVVGDTIFATEFDIQDLDDIDYRLRMTEIPCRSHQLPPEMEAKISAFMATLALEYGGIDFRLTAEGQYVFFEINTAGEFLYLEDRTGQPIAQCMAAHLAGGKAARRRKPQGKESDTGSRR